MRRFQRTPAALGFAVTGVRYAHASALLADAPDCSISPHALQCRLDGFLHLLTIASILLSMLLVGLIGLAVYLYRRNMKKELLP